jgi:hypothetical protein
MFIKSLLTFKNLLNKNLVVKSSLCKLIRVVNMKNSMLSFKKMALHIMYHVLMLTNKMVRLSVNIVILLKLVSLYLHTPLCL